MFKKASTQTAGVIHRVFLRRAFRFLSDNLRLSTFVFFLEVGENIWPKHCYPKVLADGKASKRVRERRGRGGERRHPVEVLPPLRQLCLMKRGEESLTHSCRHTRTHADLRSTRCSRCRDRRPRKTSALCIYVIVYSGWPTHLFPCRFDPSYINCSFRRF